MTKLPTNIEQGYKVVVCNPRGDNKLYSCFIHDGLSGRVQYHKGKWSKPKSHCGPLAVFDNYELAVKFVINHLMPIATYRYGHMYQCEIWKCEFVSSKSTTLYRTEYRSKKRVKIVSPLGRTFPLHLGTRFAKKVRLVKKMR